MVRRQRLDHQGHLSHGLTAPITFLCAADGHPTAKRRSEVRIIRRQTEFFFFFFFKSLKPSTKTISIRHLMFSHGNPVLDFQLMNFRHPIILPNTCVVLSFFVGSL